ncbi:MAG: SPOR domain-containing protein [Bryobacterales bacterium]|nr:SPOR domain-containing protein [Bryobacterales bacterium]
MSIRWDSLVGHPLDEAGRYRLHALEEVTADHASYAIRLGDNKPGLVEVVVSSEQEGPALLDRWASIRDLHNDFLSPVLDTGQVAFNGETLLYRVTERPDTTLAEVLGHTRLTVDEARDITQSLLACLDYLHHKGFVHGAVRAENVVAVGDRTKLTPFTIHQQREDSTPAADMYAIGQLIVSMLGDDVQSIADRPLRALAVACLASREEDRPSAADAARRLTGLIPPELDAERPAPAAVHEPAPTARAAMPEFSRRLDADPEDQEPGSKAKYLWAALAVALTVAILFAFRTRPAAPVAKSTQAAQPVEVAKVEVRPVEPAKATVTKAAPPTATPAASAGAAPNTWGIIAATYRNREAAQRRADDLKKRYAGCDCGVFTPPGGGSNFYVLVGSASTRIAAERIRQKAAQSGLPRDMYVTRLVPEERKKGTGRRR